MEEITPVPHPLPDTNLPGPQIFSQIFTKNKPRLSLISFLYNNYLNPFHSSPLRNVCFQQNKIFTSQGPLEVLNGSLLIYFVGRPVPLYRESEKRSSNKKD